MNDLKISAISESASAAARRAQALLAKAETTLIHTDGSDHHTDHHTLRALDQIIELADALHAASDSVENVKSKAFDFNASLSQSLERVQHVQHVCDKLETFVAPN